eukprot:1561093-Amphidinium_carterae.1
MSKNQAVCLNVILMQVTCEVIRPHTQGLQSSMQSWQDTCQAVAQQHRSELGHTTCGGWHYASVLHP